MNKRQKKTVANVVIIALIVIGVVWIASVFVHVGGEYTNNAQVEQDIVDVNSRVQGFVERVYVDEYCQVSEGDTLLTIDDSEYVLHLAQAEATLANVRAGKVSAEKGIRVAQNQTFVIESNIDQMEVLLSNAEQDYQRFKTLYEQEAVTKQQYEAAATHYASLKAKAETLRRQRAGSGIVREQTQQRIEQQQAEIEVAEAAVRLARLNLSYCTVVAPCSGHTARRMVQEGELVQPGMRLFSIVSDKGCWVMANFRETQRGGIAVGSAVEMTVDAFPKTTFHGVVVSISSATGAQYSPMAPDNSTGSFVKVEQRIPVKIAFTDDNDAEVLRQLSAGLNVECTVKR